MSDERRAYRRHPVHWEATLLCDSTISHRAVIKDICAGGLFLSTDAEVAEQSPKAHSPVRVRFHDPLGEKTRTLSATVARRTKDGIGLVFDTAHPDVVTILRSAGSVNTPPTPAARAPSTPIEGLDTDWLRKIVGQHVERFAREVVPGFFADLIDELFNRSRASPSADQQDMLFQAYRRISAERARLRDAFVRRILAQVQELGAHKAAAEQEDHPATSTTEPEELELVDEREFEDWLLRSEVVGRAESRYRQALQSLNRRFDALLARPMDSRDNPIAPEGFARLLGAALSIERFPPLAVRAIYHVFDRVVLARAGQLYETINNELRSAGVLPNAETERPRIHTLGGGRQRMASDPPASQVTDPVPEPIIQQPDAQPSTTGEPGPPDPAAAQPTVTPQPPAAGASSSTASVVNGSSTTQLANLVAAMEYANDSAATAPRPPNEVDGPAGDNSALITQLRSLDDSTIDVGTLGAKLNLHAAHESQRSAVTRVDQWFAQAARDGGTPDFLRHWSGSLAVLALEQQLDTGRFLSGADEPVNRLIDQVDRAGVALGTLGKEARDKLRGELDAVLQRAQRERTPAALEAATEEIAARTAAPLQNRAANMQRVLQQCEGTQRLERARRTVDDALAGRIAGHRIPKPLAEFLDTGWVSLLTLVYLRCGDNDQTWRRCLAVVDRLLIALGKDDTPPRPVRDPQRILDFARHQLERFGRLTTALETLIGQIENAVTEICNNGALTQPLPQTQIPVHEPSDPESTNAANSPWLDRARLLRPGDWVVFSGDAQTPEPLRLQWRADDRSQFVFVNRAGRRGRTLSLKELAEQLRASAEVVEDLDTPFTERQWRRSLARAHDALVHQATHDPITGLYNRKTFLRALERRHGNTTGGDGWALLQLSLDGFSKANARLGHAAGDRLLRRVARLIKRGAGEHGLAARISGDEFAVIIAQGDSESAFLLAERLRRSVARLPATGDGDHARVTATGCVAAFRGDDVDTRQLLRRVEEARRSARLEGGDRLATLAIHTNESAQEQAHLAALLDHALDNDSLSLRAQSIRPVINEQAPERRYELFVALHDRSGEQMFSPARFLTAAHQDGRMPRLDHAMVVHGMSVARRLVRRDGGSAIMHVNIGGPSVTDPAFLHALEQLQVAGSDDGAKLCLEISEGVAARALSSTVQFAERARELGCEVCIDGFGTALAAYDFLKILPVDLFKLDGQFIQELDRDDNDQALVRAITELAHLLGRRTIASQVERNELLVSLRDIGVDFAQGYAIEPVQALR